MRPRLLLPALAAVIFLFGAPNAFGNVYCVGLSSCGGTSEPDLQTALDAAKANAGPDSVVIAPGTYTSTTGFDYTDGNNSNTVDISNVPLQPRPTLTLTGTASQQHALTLQQQGSSVSEVNIDVPDTAFSLFGLELQGSTASGVTVNTPSSSTALNTGVQMSSATLKYSNINGGLDFSIGVDARNSSVVKDNTITGTRGVETFGNPVQISRNRISSDFKGLSLQGGTSINIDNVLIDMRGGTGSASYGLFASTTPSFPTATVNASQLTIRNGDSHTIGVEEQTGVPSSTITVNLTDSIIRDVGHASELNTITPPDVFTLNADHDDYDQSTDLPASLGSGQNRTETNLVNVDPLFLNPVFGVNGISGDYRLAYNSPVIDQGDSAPRGVGAIDGAPEYDLRGETRIVDGAAPLTGAVRDLGAYEYQHRLPDVISTAYPVVGVAPGQPVSFGSDGSFDLDGDPITYAWTFDDGATATVPSLTHAFATPGTHTATLAVTDATGLTASSSVQVSVVAPATPQTTTPRAKKCKKHRKHRAAAAKKCKKRKRR